MAGNVSEQSRAFQAAEAAVRDAEAEIDAGMRITNKYTGPAGDSAEQRRTRGTQDLTATAVIFSSTLVSGAACGGQWTCTNGLCYQLMTTCTDEALKTAEKTRLLNTTVAAPTPYTEYGAITGVAALDPGTVAAPPRYIIEFTCEMPLGSGGSATACLYTYRITAMGFGPRISSRAVIEAIYRAD